MAMAKILVSEADPDVRRLLVVLRVYFREWHAHAPQHECGKQKADRVNRTCSKRQADLQDVTQVLVR